MRLLGCDVGAEFIIIHDGKTATKITTPIEAQAHIKPSDVVILEQTGAYGVRWCELFQSLGAKVYIADGRDFKNYRLAHSRKKDDATDALYLIQYYKEKPHKCRPYNPQQVHIRALIRQHIRNQKDITQHANRLRQYLAVIYPNEDLYKATRHRLFKDIEKLIKRLKETPHALSPLAVAEAQKLQICITQAQHLQEEIISIARNHPDYHILRTFPLGDLSIATLLAYSWDIRNFRDKDGYIAYVLMGANLEQSGKSINRTRTDKARTEIKGIFYTAFMQAHREKSPLNPLAKLSKELINAKHNYKKRYIKFLSRLLELTYYARRDRTTYAETIKRKLYRLRAELSHTQRKDLTEYKAMKLYRLTRSIKTLEELLKQAQHKDIFDRPQDGDGKAPSLFEPKEYYKEDSHEDSPFSPFDSHSHSQPDSSRQPKDSHSPQDANKDGMHKRTLEDNAHTKPKHSPDNQSQRAGR